MTDSERDKKDTKTALPDTRVSADPRLIALVRIMARKAAQDDFDRFIAGEWPKKNASEERTTLQ